MPATTNELTYARSWIGSEESDATFNERYDRLGSLNEAILESLRAQRAAFVLDQPASVTTPDGMSVSFGDNIKALDELIDKFANFADLPNGSEDADAGSDITPSIAKLSRTQYR